jgi:hypothetical protein|tara:strand:+ start:8532 stop:9674 length:1143 start_codon:yes stop_codon:yes gene_type:complete
MSLYIAHPLDDFMESINLYTFNEGKELVSSIKDVAEIGVLDDEDKLIFLIPSSLITSYKFVQNKELSTQVNLANFISEIDAKIVGQVSDNEYLFHEDNAFAINKKTLLDINTSLSSLSGTIYLVPEYSLNHIRDVDVISQIGLKYLFSYSDGTGFGVEEDFLNQYLDIVINNKPDFHPTVSSLNNDLNKRFKISNSLFSFLKLSKSDLTLLPNFFKLKISLNLLLKKLAFSRSQIAACAISLIILISAPNFLIYKNERNAKVYNSATFDIFKTINKDIKKLVSPKSQIDQLLKDIPDNLNTKTNLPNLDLFYNLSSKYLTRSSIDLNKSSATITIESMPELQYRLIQGASSKFGISIVNSDVDFQNGFVDGEILLEFDNE